MLIVARQKRFLVLPLVGRKPRLRVPLPLRRKDKKAANAENIFGVRSFRLCYGLAGSGFGDAMKLRREMRKNVVCRRIAQSLRNDFGENVAVVNRDLQILLLVQLFRGESGPLREDAPARDFGAKHEHRVAMPVIGSLASVFADVAPELRHRDGRYIGNRSGLNVGMERAQAAREIFHHPGEMPVYRPFLIMRVPPAQINVNRFHANIGLDEDGGSGQRISKRRLRIRRASARNVAAKIQLVQQVDRVDRVFPPPLSPGRRCAHTLFPAMPDFASGFCRR